MEDILLRRYSFLKDSFFASLIEYNWDPFIVVIYWTLAELLSAFTGEILSALIPPLLKLSTVTTNLILFSYSSVEGIW